MRAAGAGALYFAIVFAAGFVLGAVRAGVLAPAIGEMAATLAELPVILGASWFACLFVVRRFEVEAGAAARLVMGAVAFALLIGAEIVLGLALMNRTAAEQIAAMGEAPALVGLAGQFLFALFPLIGLAWRR